MPKGKQVTGIILMLAIASGIPMMVTAWAIGDAAHGASSGHRHYFATKGPQYIVGNPEAGHTGRQGYYQDAGDNAEEDVAQGQPDTTEKQPNDV